MIFRMTLIERKDENMFASKVEADSLTEAIYQALDTHGFFDDLDTERDVDIYHFSDIQKGFIHVYTYFQRKGITPYLLGYVCNLPVTKSIMADGDFMIKIS